MASDNPDMVIRDDLFVLVEYKSEGEWGPVLKLDKRVGGEFVIYQQYAEDVNANSVLFVCEAKTIDQKRFLIPFRKLVSKKIDKIIVRSWSFLDNASRDQKVRQRLHESIKNPDKYESEKRLLFMTEGAA